MQKLLLIFLLFLSNGAAHSQQLQISVQQLAPNVWVHTSYKMFGKAKVPSNGLIIQTAAGTVLIDTAWGDEQTEQLLQWAQHNLHHPVKQCIITHAHDDRMGGIKVLQQHGIEVISSYQTKQLAAQQMLGNTTPAVLTDTSMVIGKQVIKVFYPGAGHAPDNLVVYLPKQRILFGGCLIRDTQAKTLGNTAEADLNNWPFAVKYLQQKFPKAKIIVPGHGPWAGKKILSHTLKLLQELSN